MDDNLGSVSAKELLAIVNRMVELAKLNAAEMDRLIKERADEAERRRKERVEEARRRKKQAETEERRRKQRAEEELRRKKQAEAEERRKKMQAEAEERYRKEQAEAEERRRKEQAEAEERRKKVQAEAEERYRKEQAEAEALRRKERAEIDKQIKELGKQIGGLGNKYGAFAEALAFPSMEKILHEQYGMETFQTRIRTYKEFGDLELDAMAFSNGKSNKVFIIEVKSHLRREDIGQIINEARKFHLFHPEHKTKSVYSILAFVDGEKSLVELVRKKGIYTARISGDVFEMKVPKGFQPVDFSRAA